MPEISITAYQGETIPFLLDQIADLYGDLFTDFSGWKFAFALAADETDADADALITRSSEADGEVEFDAGSIAFELSGAEMQALEPGFTYVFGGRLLGPAGEVISILKGTLELLPALPKRTA